MGNEPQGGVGATDVKEENNDIGDLQNRDVKNHPLFKKLTSQLGEATKKLDELASKEAEREKKAAERKSDYEKALRITAEQAVKDAREKWDAEQAISSKLAEAKLQLVKAGFKNEAFIKGLLSDFDPNQTTPEDFAKAAVEADENKPFLSQSTAQRSNPNPDPQSLNSAKVTMLTDVEIEQLRRSGKPEDIAKAHKALLDGWTG